MCLFTQPQAYSKLDFFVDDRTYWTPCTTAPEIYDQLALKKYREISRKQLEYVKFRDIKCALLSN